MGKIALVVKVENLAKALFPIITKIYKTINSRI